MPPFASDIRLPAASDAGCGLDCFRTVEPVSFSGHRALDLLLPKRPIDCNKIMASYLTGSQLGRTAARVLPRSVVRGRKNPLHWGMGSRLKKARRLAGLKRQPLTRLASLPDGSAIVGMERGERIPRLDTVERIAYALGLSPAFLAYGIEGEAGPLPRGLRCEAVAHRLTAERAARGLSVLAVAKLAGLSHTAVGNVERGTMPTLATAEALAKALDLSPGWLAFGIGSRELPRRRGRMSEAAATPA